MIYTGIDGEKTYSIDYSLLRRNWSSSDRLGKKIYVIPSHLTYVKKETTQIGDIYNLRKALWVEIEEKFGDVFWDVKLSGDRYCLALIRDFSPPEDAYSLDPEIFSLARVCRATSENDCFVLDIGKRKTTLVEVVGGELESYRVVLKGGDFIDKYLTEKIGVGKEEAERIKISEGLKSDHVRAAFETILSSLGKDLSDKKVLLSGGVSKLTGIESYFGAVLRNEYVPPEMNSAFGASLKYVYRDCSPEFREEELSERDIKKVIAVFGTSLLLFMAVNFSLGFLEKRIVKDIRGIEKKEFRRVFPNLPAVAVRDQLKSLLERTNYNMTAELILLSEKLSEGLKLYKIEYGNGVLKVVGEAESKKILEKLSPKSIKKTPEGKFEFEVEIR